MGDYGMVHLQLWKISNCKICRYLVFFCKCVNENLAPNIFSHTSMGWLTLRDFVLG